MIELHRHIETLLLDNDCVIVPDFGGFVTHWVCARYDEEDHSFLPPLRTLGFNPQLRLNDSLLVQSYVNTYDISYPEALRRIEDEVNELKQKLDVHGCYTLDNIGELTVNSEGTYVFEPCEAGILSPQYYGLDAVEFWTLKDSRQQAAIMSVGATVSRTPENNVQLPVTPSLLDFTDSEDNKERAVEIKMSWIRNAVAVAAAVIVFFMMASPIANSDLGTNTMGQLESKLLYKLLPKDSNMTLAEPVIKESAGTEETTETTESDEVMEKNTPTPTPTYCIVLASQVKKSNADYFVEQLHKEGYSAAEVYIHNKILRVVYGAFETESEAYNQLNKLRSDKKFEEAWIYKKEAVI